MLTQRGSPVSTPGLRTQALLYERLSGKRQARGGVSLGVQEKTLRKYALDHAMTIVGEFSDVVTGRRADRRDYQRLLSEARRLVGEGWPVAVVVPKVARFGRGRVEWARAIEEFEELQIPIHSVANGGVVPPLVLDMLSAVAVEESRETGDRVKTVARSLLADGWAWAGVAPWAYRWRNATPEEALAKGARLVEEAEEGEKRPRVLDLTESTLERQTVLRTFQRIAAGHSKRSVLAWLATLAPEARGGRTANHATLDKTLRSPVYVARPPSEGDIAAGMTKYGRTKGGFLRRRRLNGERELPEVTLARPVGRWPALIDDGLWLAVQRRLGTGTKTGQPGRKPSGRFPLTGFLRCGRCGSRMVGHVRHWQGADGTVHEQRSYACIGVSKKACRAEGQRVPSAVGGPVLPAGIVEASAEAQVRELVARVGHDRTVWATLEEDWEALRATPAQAEALATAASLRADLVKSQERVRRFQVMLADEDMTQDEYRRAVQTERASQVTLTAALAEAEARGALAGGRLPPLAEVIDRLREAALAELYGELVERVVAARPDGWDGKRGRWVAQVDWTAEGEALARLRGLR